MVVKVQQKRFKGIFRTMVVRVEGRLCSLVNRLLLQKKTKIHFNTMQWKNKNKKM